MSDSMNASKESPTERPEASSERTPLRFLHRVTDLLAHYGVETHGCVHRLRCSTRWTNPTPSPSGSRLFQRQNAPTRGGTKCFSCGFRPTLMSSRTWFPDENPRRHSGPTDHVRCSFGTGTVGPAFFSLGVRDSIIVLIVTDLV